MYVWTINYWKSALKPDTIFRESESTATPLKRLQLFVQNDICVCSLCRIEFILNYRRKVERFVCMVFNLYIGLSMVLNCDPVNDMIRWINYAQCLSTMSALQYDSVNTKRCSVRTIYHHGDECAYTKSYNYHIKQSVLILIMIMKSLQCSAFNW